MVNGEYTHTLPVTDRGLQYGDGVWETVAIREGQVIQLQAHLSRLKRGLDTLAIRPVDFDTLEQEITAHVRHEKQTILKIIITRGSGGRGYSPQGCHQPTRILSLHPWPDYPASYVQSGIHLTLCQTRLSRNPRLAGFKHLNRLEQILARAEISEPYQEGLMRDEENNIIEATMSNLFLVKNDNEIVTPDLEQCGIEGIARSCIMTEIQKMGIRLSIEPVSLEAIEQAEGLFVTNSIIKIWPVKQFKQIPYIIPDSVLALHRRVQGRL